MKSILTNKFTINNYKSLLTTIFGERLSWQADKSEDFNDNKKGIDYIVQWGEVALNDMAETTIPIFEVKLTNKTATKITRNRVGLQSTIKQLINYTAQDAALTAFWSETQKEWRFSFIMNRLKMDEETGEEWQEQTEPKRFTYVFGEYETVRTAEDRLQKLANDSSPTLDSITDAFSVEKLSKDFFKEYVEHYDSFCQYLYAEEDYTKNIFNFRKTDTPEERKKKEKAIRDFVKKMMGRIVFLYFVQKKGWLGVPATRKDWKKGERNFIQRLFQTAPDPNQFYSNELTKLFYQGLNKEKDRFRTAWGNVKIPFLNGGLFEDDFQATNQINFPSNYFQNLFDFFAKYNFTIDENRTDEHEVGIDPEMLGHIFENLLEDNKEKGAFYTPKEIVHYMCQESLLQYLKTHFKDAPEGILETFVRKKERTDEVETYLRKNGNALKSRLQNVKICDPAIGSGAFPMGILHEIYDCLMTLDWTLDPAKVKKAIIENSIYGVDIDKGAIDIARLRFWLSLVVDEATEQKPPPLPNLDFKIMQGNSLLESFEGIDLSKASKVENDVKIIEPQRDLFGNIVQNQLKITFAKSSTITEINRLIRTYFNIKSKHKKEDTKRKIDREIKENIIEYNLELRENQLHRQIAEAKQAKKLSRKATKELAKKEAELANFPKIRERLEIIEKEKEKPYFLWNLYFKDVFDFGGFDIVIGNPPYIQLQKMGKKADELKNKPIPFKTYSRTGDIYELFYEQGYRILKPNGILTYITSNKWMRTKYGQSTRHFFATQTNPLKLIDFGGFQIFDNATVDANILILKKDKNQNKTIACRFKKDYKKGNSITSYINKNKILLSKLSQKAWVVVDPKTLFIKNKIELLGTPLKDWNISIYRGILTGYNKAFIINEETKDKLIEEDPNNKTIIKPILRGRDIKKYYADFNRLWLISTFPVKKINIDNHPSIKNYLQDFLPKLRQTGETFINQNNKTEKTRKKTGNNWFETQDQISYYKHFKKPKIMYPNMTKYLPFLYDDTDHYFLNDKGFILTGDNIKYLCAFLNSNLFKFCFLDNFPELQGGTRELRKVFFEHIPVKIPTKTEQKPFEEKVEAITKTKKTNKDTTTLEQEIDTMVYKLYDLTYEEVLIIQPDFKDIMTKTAYDAFTF